MSDRRRSPDRLATLLDVGLQLRSEEAAERVALRRRDRAIGQALGAGERHDPWRRARAWLDGIRSSEASERLGASLSAGRRVGALLLGMLALAAGSVTAAAVFAYDGRHPVNVLWALAIFVALPLLLMLGTGIAMLPPAARHGVPGLAALQDLWLAANPARLWSLALRWLPDRMRDSSANALGLLRSEWVLYGEVQRWLLLSLSQGLALCFQTGAIATFLGLTFLTDLAFGWSTTLEVEPETLASIVQPLARPFGWLVPDAVPSTTLIESTRYYRLGAGLLPGGDPGLETAASLGGWWPFLACAMTLYGALPRLGLWLLARRRLAVALDRALEQTPGYASLVDRLEAPLVETGAFEIEAGSAAAAGAALAAAPERGPCVVIDWAAVGLEPARIATLLQEELGLSVERVHAAGGEQSPEADAAVVRSAVAEAGEGACVVLVRAWEPPVLEFLDFLAELRDAWGPAHPLVVVPVALASDGSPTAPASADLEEWRRKLRSVGDPWLSLRPLLREAA